jgi:hypothetical protein
MAAVTSLLLSSEATANWLGVMPRAAGLSLLIGAIRLLPS